MSVTTASRTPPGFTSATATAAPARALLSRLFAASPDLPAFAPATLKVAPAGDRHPAELAAAARAVACPDLCLVHAPDPAAGERVIADVAHHVATSTAGRVLVLSPNPAAADRITERLVRIAQLGVVRTLADAENPARPSPIVAQATSAALGVGRVEQLRQEARAAVAAAETRLQSLDRLAELAARLQPLDAAIAELTAQRDRIETEIRAETGTTFAARLSELAARHETTVARLTADCQAAHAEHAKQEAAVAALRAQLAQATRKPGLFTRLFGKPKHADPAATEAELHAVENRVSELANRTAALREELAAAAATATAEREQLIAAEVATRRTQVEVSLDQLTAERERLRAEFADVLPLLETTPATELEANRTTLVGEIAKLRGRAAELDACASDLVRQFLTEPRVLVGTPGSLGVDPALQHDFRDPDASPLFELLILDQAEELTEADFVHLSRLAGRWVLVGDASPPSDSKSYTNGVHPRNGSRYRPNGRPVEVPFVVRLAQVLDREHWAHEGERLVCRLAHLTPDERSRMNCEPLLDHPEIELRFSIDPAGNPILAEVVFPEGTTVDAAKRFVFHQLGEVLLHPCGELCWDHTEALISARWPAAEHTAAAATAWVELEAGVREKVVGTCPAAFTAAVTFDPAAGWDTEKAAAWLALHLPAASTARLAVVPLAAHSPRSVRA